MFQANIATVVDVKVQPSPTFLKPLYAVALIANGRGILSCCIVFEDVGRVGVKRPHTEFNKIGGSRIVVTKRAENRAALDRCSAMGKYECCPPQ